MLDSLIDDVAGVNGPLITGASFKRGKSKQNYATPPEFMQALKNYGWPNPAIDLAADATNTKAHKWFDEAQDSLKQDWAMATRGGMGWLNPPFSNIAQWVQKAWVESRRGACVLMLIPASVGSNWYRDYVHNRAEVTFLVGGIAFDPDHPEWGYPKDCMLCYYTPSNTFTSTRPRVWTWKESL